MHGQQQLIFFNLPGENDPLLPAQPTEEMLRHMVSEQNPDCPLNQIVDGPKNQMTMLSLRSMVYSALSKQNHSCRGMNFGIYSDSGQGRTNVVRAFAETVKIPTIFVQSATLKSTLDLYQLILEKMTSVGTPLVHFFHERKFKIPPCLVVFEDAHSLSTELRSGGLLSAMDANDGWLGMVPSGSNQKQYEIDCTEVCWIAASTDPGSLWSHSKAFCARFSVHFFWHEDPAPVSVAPPAPAVAEPRPPEPQLAPAGFKWVRPSARPSVAPPAPAVAEPRPPEPQLAPAGFKWARPSVAPPAPAVAEPRPPEPQLAHQTGTAATPDKLEHETPRVLLAKEGSPKPEPSTAPSPAPRRTEQCQTRQKLWGWLDWLAAARRIRLVYTGQFSYKIRADQEMIGALFGEAYTVRFDKQGNSLLVTLWRRAVSNQSHVQTQRGRGGRHIRRKGSPYS
jgi:hypothetical protein